MNNPHFEPAAIVWAQVWQVTLVALVLGLAARFGCRRRPHLAYLLWMLVVLKALTPPLVASPTGLFSWALRVESPAPNVPEPLQVVREPALPRQIPVTLVPDEPTAFVAGPRPAPAPQEPELVSRVSLAGLLLAIWLAGAVALAVYAVFKWRTCRRSWSAGAMPVPTALEQGMRGLAERLGIRPGVCGRMRLLVSRNAASPAVFGVWRPTVLLPAAVVERDGAAPVGLEPILAHELVHVRRGDTTAALLQLVAQLIWWFHPLMWWANREARRERERACDEEVVTGLGCRARDYARALLDVLERQSPQAAFAVPGVGMLGVTARAWNTCFATRPIFTRARRGPITRSRLSYLCSCYPAPASRSLPHRLRQTNVKPPTRNSAHLAEKGAKRPRPRLRPPTQRLLPTAAPKSDSASWAPSSGPEPIVRACCTCRS